MADFYLRKKSFNRITQVEMNSLLNFIDKSLKDSHFQIITEGIIFNDGDDGIYLHTFRCPFTVFKPNPDYLWSKEESKLRDTINRLNYFSEDF